MGHEATPVLDLEAVQRAEEQHGEAEANCFAAGGSDTLGKVRLDQYHVLVRAVNRAVDHLLDFQRGLEYQAATEGTSLDHLLKELPL